MYFADALELGKPRRTSDGYLAVRARAAKTGVYQYTGREVDPDNAHGLRDQAIVNVLRDEQTVFDKSAVATFIGKPITDDHPSVAVNRDNWRDHGRGVIMGALRDGDHLAFDLLLMDGPTIDKVEAGKRQLSNGYAAELQFGDFDGPGGVKCQARQSRISNGNHVAVVNFGRGGDSCAIGDVATCDSIPLPKFTNDGESIVTTKTITFDGLPLLVTDAAEAAIGKLQAQIGTLTTAKDAAQAKSVAEAATVVAKDAEIEKLKKQLEDAKLTPAQMREAGKAYAIVADKAKAHGITVTDAMDEAAIKRAVVDKAMGDKAKNYSDEHVSIAFETLTKDHKVDQPKVQSLGSPAISFDAAGKEQAALDAANDHNAWRTAGAAK